MKKSILSMTLALSLCIGAAYAEESSVKIIGSVPAFVPLSIPKTAAASTGQSGKEILLQHIKLSKQANRYIIERLRALENKNIFSAATPPPSMTLPPSVDLGMNNVPVLDQGRHGACVTFASTAMIDAAYGKGDYISQLCNLSLGSYIAKHHAFYPSGWNGSTDEIVLDQIKTYGIISMAYQLKQGCAGVKQYPLNDGKNEGKRLSKKDFAKHSENILSSMSYTQHLTTHDAFTKRENADDLFDKTKQALANQHRVLISFLVDDNDHTAGNFGTYKVRKDSWILTPSILKDFEADKIRAGHAVVVIGYDDNAVIDGPENTKHIGAFIIRNSWSDKVGDHGNYYISYDYFKTLVDEIVELSPTKV